MSPYLESTKSRKLVDGIRNRDGELGDGRRGFPAVGPCTERWRRAVFPVTAHPAAYHTFLLWCFIKMERQVTASAPANLH